MMFVRAGVLNRSLCESLPPVWHFFWIVISCFSVYDAYGLVRKKAIDPGRTAKRVDARYTWRDLDAFSHKSKRIFYSTLVSLYLDSRTHVTVKDQVMP